VFAWIQIAAALRGVCVSALTEVATASKYIDVMSMTLFVMQLESGPEAPVCQVWTICTATTCEGGSTMACDAALHRPLPSYSRSV